MRKKIIGIMIFILLISTAFGGRRYSRAFLTTAVSCGTTTTLVNGVGFASAKIPIPAEVNTANLIVTFTRTTGSAAKVYFDFQVSYDNATTWTTDEFIRVEIPTNTKAVSNLVVHSELIALHGCSHIRLSEIQNVDAGVALTLCNATLSY
jgi:hypothetical protein